jgi:hypothetical protein
MESQFAEGSGDRGVPGRERTGLGGLRPTALAGEHTEGIAIPAQESLQYGKGH